MTILIGCLFFALLLPFIAKVPLAIAMNKQGGYDNKYPREQQGKLTGFGARALAGHQNAFESIIIFAPAILLAISTKHTGDLIQQLALTHVVARIFYHIFYTINISTLRSISWAIGIISSFSIIWQCLP